MEPTELVATGVITLFFALVFGRASIPLAFHFRLLDHPNSRKRHKERVPVIGGLVVFVSWFTGLGLYSLQNPTWFTNNIETILPVGVSLLTLIATGLVDDVKSMPPWPKLAFQGFAAFIVLFYEPNINGLMQHWSQWLGIYVWPLGFMWLVGITNAVNLVDGLDGLAGGMSGLVAVSILILCMWSTPPNEFALVSMVILIPSIIAFLKFNWNPAKIFLGDNGSLPMGFLLGTTALMARPQNKSWIMIVSVVLMLGYPILDMGLCTLRRSKMGLPLFKADRNHLHHRLQHMGLTVKQTAVLLLSLGAFLQVSALTVNLMSPPSATLGITMIVFSIFTLMFLVEAIEKIRVRHIVDTLKISDAKSKPAVSEKFVSVVRVDLMPLFEGAVIEGAENLKKTRDALTLMLHTIVRKDDRIIPSHHAIHIVLTSVDKNDLAAQEAIGRSFSTRIREFLNLYNINCTLSSLPIHFETRLCRFDHESDEVEMLESKAA